jgi:hypothetical protein
MSSKDRTYHIRSQKSKSPEVETVLDKKLYIIVDNKHRPVHHKDGHFLFFSSKRRAENWMEKYRTDETWRIERLIVTILR